MNREDGILLHPQGFPNSAWNDHVQLKDLLQKKTEIPCEIDNGANTAALGEFLFGSGRGYKCVAYIHCGVGIRTAIIKDGLILRTMNDREDAFAHMSVDFNGSLCKCGGKGCLESYVSLESISLRYNTSTGNHIGYKELFDRAADNDEAAVEAFNYSAKILGVGISNLAKLLNPDIVILSGPLMSNYDPFYSICVDAFHERNSLNNKLIFSKEGLFKEDVVAIGAGLMAIEQHFK
jgi:predicted NBD/HSP70 family sugar kinase